MVRQLYSNPDYRGNMDSEVIDICNAINALPGLSTKDSCCGHGKDFFSIFFMASGCGQGLFFLTRCCDRRYWKYGNDWSIILSVGDIFKNEILPINFLLESSDKGEKVYAQANDLIRNMNMHLNHEAFIKGYNLDVSKFSFKEM